MDRFGIKKSVHFGSFPHQNKMGCRLPGPERFSYRFQSIRVSPNRCSFVPRKKACSREEGSGQQGGGGRAHPMEAAPHSNFSQMLPRHETFSEKSVLSRSELWHLPGFLVPAAYPVLTSFSKKSQGAAPCLPLCLVLDDQEGLSGSVQTPD